MHISYAFKNRTRPMYNKKNAETIKWSYSSAGTINGLLLVYTFQYIF